MIKEFLRKFDDTVVIKDNEKEMRVGEYLQDAKDRKIAWLQNEVERLQTQLKEEIDANEILIADFNTLLEKYNNFDGVREIEALRGEHAKMEAEYRKIQQDYTEEFVRAYNRGFHDGRVCVFSEMGLMEDVLTDQHETVDDLEIALGDVFDD